MAAALVVVVAGLAAASSSGAWSVRFPDELKRVKGLSAAAVTGNYLLIASDETTEAAKARVPALRAKLKERG